MYNLKNFFTLIICHFSQETAASGVLILKIAFKYKQYSLQAATLSLKGKWEHGLFENKQTNKSCNLQYGVLCCFWEGKGLDDDPTRSSQWLQRVWTNIIFSVDIIEMMMLFGPFPEHSSFSVCAWLCDPNAGDVGKTTA